MPAQRTRAAFAPDQRSAHPGIAGVPPWAAVVIAVSATLTGFAIEAGSGNTELGFVFAAFYALGCIAAVLAVRHSGIFTAVIQPPLLLFIAVPFAYFMFHGSSFNGLKDVLITCGYPLIERFPLMLFTSAAVLVIGLGRWYFSVGRDHSDVTTAGNAPVAPGLFSGLAARVAAFTRPASDAEPRHGISRSAQPRRRPPADRAPRPERSRRPGEPTRSRHARPLREDEYDMPPRPRRRPAPASARDDVPRERPRRPRESSRRTPPPQRRDPRAYPPAGRGYEPYREEPPRRRPAPDSSPSAHHPVSGVRYRGDAPEDRPRR